MLFDCVPRNALIPLIRCAEKHDPAGAMVQYNLERRGLHFVREGPPPGGLFDNTPLVGASGKRLTWKLECDALTDQDWEWAAHRAVELCPKFGSVVGVPTGGNRFAEAVSRVQSPTPGGPVLMVDDVITTGGSFKRYRSTLGLDNAQVIAVGLFDRRVDPNADRWIHGILILHAVLARNSIHGR